LFDALSNPHADIGAQLPSLLRWEFHPEREIPHVVLGRYEEGGIWQVSEMSILLKVFYASAKHNVVAGMVLWLFMSL